MLEPGRAQARLDRALGALERVVVRGRREGDVDHARRAGRLGGVDDRELAGLVDARDRVRPRIAREGRCGRDDDAGARERCGQALWLLDVALDDVGAERFEPGPGGGVRAAAHERPHLLAARPEPAAHLRAELTRGAHDQNDVTGVSSRGHSLTERIVMLHNEIGPSLTFAQETGSIRTWPLLPCCIRSIR